MWIRSEVDNDVQYGVVGQLLILLTVANGTPVLAKRMLGDRLSHPLDSGLPFFDGRPLFGRSKTIRGVLIAIVATTLAAPLLGLEFRIGAVVGGTAMVGDLLSSFTKRRLGMPASSRAMALDQVPESALPLLACRDALSLTTADILVGTAVFLVGEVLLSRLLFKMHVRDQPY